MSSNHRPAILRPVSGLAGSFTGHAGGNMVDGLRPAFNCWLHCCLYASMLGLRLCVFMQVSDAAAKKRLALTKTAGKDSARTAVRN